MNVFLHELKAYRKSVIIWACSLAAIIVVFLSMYPGFSKDAAEFQRLIEGFPEAVRKAFGLTGDMSSLLNFYAYVFLYIVLCGAIQAMNIGISIISKETRQRTADFLLTKPVARNKVMTNKLLAAFISIIVTNIIYLAAALIMAGIVKNDSFSMNIFIMISITLFFIQLIFMALGVLVSVLVPKIKSVISVSLGTVFGFFVINMFGSVLGEEALKYITPFKYFDAGHIIKNGRYEIQFVILSLVIVIAAITASYIIYSKKDIHAV